ncbi:MAG: hypothetical protein KGH79_01215 [Patescibacteria group bacterium]|nr:hypothetical protein [Patescibacteria group bacterium]
MSTIVLVVAALFVGALLLGRFAVSMLLSVLIGVVLVIVLFAAEAYVHNRSIWPHVLTGVYILCALQIGYLIGASLRQFFNRGLRLEPLAVNKPAQ